MKMVSQGAEARLCTKKLDGKKVLVKERVKKGYRLKEIDERLRKVRTKAEAKLLTDARKLGIHTPQILKVEEDKIIMEFVDGKKVKDVITSRNARSLSIKIGQSIGKMHAANIIHGDLTTSNMILTKEGTLYFIDFGLGSFSKRIEDKAMDLKLLREVLKSTHWKILKPCWSNILKGYKQEYRDAGKVAIQLDDIDRRVRYAKKE